VTAQRQKELFELLRAQLLFHLKEGGENIFKEVWEECDGPEEIKFIDDTTVQLAQMLREIEPNYMDPPRTGKEASA
jgi:hypothetical protein